MLDAMYARVCRQEWQVQHGRAQHPRTPAPYHPRRACSACPSAPVPDRNRSSRQPRPRPTRKRPAHL
eukprot:2982419-Prymnesium_polylepis.1